MPYKNREDLYAAQAAYRQKTWEKVWDYLCQSECQDCGEKDPIVLQFDHLPEFEKKFDISRALSGTRSWKLIQSEIEKCEVVCANCHQRRTSRRSGDRRHMRGCIDAAP